jgi:hypothetical protein
MEPSLLSLSVAFAALWLNGFVGALLISVSLVIQGSAKEIMSAKSPKTSFLNVKEQITVL